MELRKQEGFTYPEVLMTLPIVLLSILAAMGTLLGSMQLNEEAQARTRAVNLAAFRLEQIRNAAIMDPVYFATQISAYNISPNNRYPNLVPTSAQIQAMNRLGLDPTSAEAISRITAITTSELYQIQVTVCYRTKGGRVIGEDTNLNGVINTGEDQPGGTTNVIDSPIRLTTYVARK